MVDRDSLIDALNVYLNIKDTPEMNGLQIEGRSQVRKIVFGVSAHMALFEAAQKAGADMIIAHHGLFWGNAQPLTGVFGRRCAYLINHGISLAGYHLPLDRHPVVGNNAQLAKLLGLKNIKPFGDYKGVSIGFKGVFKPAVSMENLCAKLSADCVITRRGDKIKSAAIVSGGAHQMLGQAEAAGVDLYITGTRDEYVVEYCKEAAINYITMGHYNSERLGIQALMAYVKKNFKVAVEFIDIPNPF